jgi:hypothetical protein
MVVRSWSEVESESGNGGVAASGSDGGAPRGGVKKRIGAECGNGECIRRRSMGFEQFGLQKLHGIEIR